MIKKGGTEGQGATDFRHLQRQQNHIRIVRVAIRPPGMPVPREAWIPRSLCKIRVCPLELLWLSDPHNTKDQGNRDKKQLSPPVGPLLARLSRIPAWGTQHRGDSPDRGAPRAPAPSPAWAPHHIPLLSLWELRLEFSHESTVRLYGGFFLLCCQEC